MSEEIVGTLPLEVHSQRFSLVSVVRVVEVEVSALVELCLRAQY